MQQQLSNTERVILNGFMNDHPMILREKESEHSYGASRHNFITGHTTVKDQNRDYHDVDRGEALENWSYLDYFLGTYNGLVLKEKETTRGHTPNIRVPYQEGCNWNGRCRVVRTAGHETMPYFPGRWFPK
jgi:hypothetical protein